MATATHVPARALHQPREGWLSSVAVFLRVKLLLVVSGSLRAGVYSGFFRF